MPGPGYTSPKSKRGKALGLKKPKFTYRSNTSKPAAPPKAKPKPKAKAKKPKGRPLSTGMRSVRQELNAPGYRRLRERSQRRDLKRTAEQALRVASAKPLPKRYKYVAAPKPKPLRVSPRRVGTDVPKRFASKPTASERRDVRRMRRQDERDFGKVLLAAYGKGSTKEGAKARQRLVDRGTLSGETSAAQAERFKRIMNARPKRDYPGDRVLKKGLAAAGRALDDALPNPARSTVNLGKGQTARSVARAGGRVKTGGIPETKIPKSGAAAALVAAEQLTRISSAGGKGATEAIKAIQRGKPASEVGKAYVQGQVKGFVENRSGYGDALRQLGASRGASAGIGFVLDVVLDPTTYLTLGIPAAGRAAARAAGEAAGRAAVKRGASEAVALREIRAAMRGEASVVSPGASRPRGNIAGRMRERASSLESSGESPAITRQRRQLRDLEQRGRGESRKAQNIRRNLQRAGRRKTSRVERAEDQAKRVGRRADDAASVVKSDGSLEIKPPRRSRLFASKGSPKARARNMIRPASTEAKTTFSRMAERQVSRSAKGQRTDKVLSVRFGKRRVADVPLEPFSKGAVKNSGEGAVRARRALGDVAPAVRSSAGLAEDTFQVTRQAGRVERADRGTAEIDALLSLKQIELATGRIADKDRPLWVAVWERSDNPATRVRVKDGALVFGPDDALRGVPPKFAERYLVKTRRRGYQLRGEKAITDVRKAGERAATKTGQPIGDALKIKPLDEEAEVASRYYARRAKPVKGESYADKVDYVPPGLEPGLEPDTVGRAFAQQEGSAVLGGRARGNILSRKDPRPQDVGNAERLVSESARVRPEMGANPPQDFAAYRLNMERVAAYNRSVQRLATAGDSVRFKATGDESIDEFYRRHGIMNGEPESVGKTVYELAVRGEGAGRYDLREVEPEILEQLVTGKAPGGKPSKLTRKGQYVILDRRAVDRFREFRSGEILADNKGAVGEGLRIWDRLGARIRQLAIFTPMYQAINEMGDTWIMYTVVPGYKIPYYKGKALPVVRYLQAAEAGNRRVMRELGEAEMMVGGKFMKVKDIARLTRREGQARAGVFANTVKVSNPEVRQVTKQGKPKGRVREAAADKFASSDPQFQLAVTAPKRAAESTGRFFRSREDWNRVATWLYFVDESYSTGRAVDESLAALIDYGELSKFERNYARRLAFFYTFPARQIPYQTKALFRRPGKLAAYEKLRVAAADYQNIDLSDLYEQPWYVQANVPIPLRIGGEVRWVSANLPFNMLNQTLPVGSNWPVFGKGGLFQRDIDFVLSSLNPLLRAPAEDIANRNFFYRTSIEDERGMSANETPAPWYVVKLAQAVPAMQRKLGVYYKETRNSAGQKIWVMDKKWAWRLSQIAYGPLRIPASAGRFRNERGQTWADDFFRFGTGIRVDRDKRLDERSSRIFDRLAEIQEQLSKMRGDSRFEGKARWMKLQAEQKELQAEQKKIGEQMGLTWGYGEQRPKSKGGLPSLPTLPTLPTLPELK